MIYTQNRILHISKQPVIPGWAKELCYRTLNKGVFGEDDIQQVFDIFASNSAPITPAPAESPKQTLRILSMLHRKGMNALKENLELVFCEERNESVTNCHQLKLPAADGKKRLTDVADEQLSGIYG